MKTCNNNFQIESLELQEAEKQLDIFYRKASEELTDDFEATAFDGLEDDK
jgi:hypothetical protein